jgi:hypothetical protein
MIWVVLSCAFTTCLDCGYLMNHALYKECAKCGSLNVQHDYEDKP